MRFKNKVANIYAQFVLIMVFLALMSYLLYIPSSASSSFSKGIEQIVPNLEYEFPKTIINTFLHKKISPEDSLNFFGDSSEHRVRDLIWEGSDESLVRVNSMAEEYLSEIDVLSGSISSKSLYEAFSEKSVSNTIEISLIEGNYEFNVEEYIENYYVLILTKDKKFVKVAYK